MGEGTIREQMTSVMNQHVSRGIQVEMIISKERLPAGANLPEMPKNVELRKGLPELPAIIVLTEKVAGVYASANLEEE
jgi:hypothetical protein